MDCCHVCGKGLSAPGNRNGFGKTGGNRFKRSGRLQHNIGSLQPQLFFPGVDKDNYPQAAAFFEKLGYQASKEDYSMCKNPHGYALDADARRRKQTAEDLIMIVVDKERKICGFCMRMIDGNPSRFSPTGIAKEKRNDGIGSVLLDVMQLEMVKRGVYHMYFVSTDAPGRRLCVYNKKLHKGEKV